MIDSSVVTLVVIVVVAVTFAWLMLWPKRRIKNEVGLTALYEESCSGHTNLGFGFSMGGNISNWRISLYDEFVLLSSITKVSIPYASIEMVEYKRSLISKGLHISSRDAKIDVTLFPRNIDRIVEILRSKNVSIAT